MTCRHIMSDLSDFSGKMTSRQATNLLMQFPPDSDLRQAIESIKQIRHAGDAIALEIFVKTMRLVINADSAKNDIELHRKVHQSQRSQPNPPGDNDRVRSVKYFGGDVPLRPVDPGRLD
jgi:hypothetical protein